MESRNYFNGENGLKRPSLLSGFSPLNKELNSHIRQTLLDQKAYNPIAEERKKTLYKNVLTFPQDIEYIKYFERTPHVEVNNSDFRDFQRHGYGRYFPVLSRLHEVEDFVPICKEY